MLTIIEYQFDLLKKELDLIDTAIRQIDDITKGIKNWAIVTWTAALGVALVTDQLKQCIWVTAIIPLLFWLLDGSYRRVQRTFIIRNREISIYVNSDDFKSDIQSENGLTFSLLQMRKKSTRWKDCMLGVLLFRTVSLLYIGLAVISFFTWIIVN